MPLISRGSRDASGKWTADDPSEYPPIDCHGIWPWSVLDRSSPAWQARKAWWLSGPLAGIDLAATGASPAMIATGRHGLKSGGVSVFDPVLAELACTWWCPSGGLVIDPCAGGPVRGLVAGALDCSYLGVDIRGEQLAVNRAALTVADPGGWQPVHWVHADGRTIGGGQADMILSCPPYHRMERYSDDPDDLSAMRWPDFVQAHGDLIAASARALRDDRHLVWVIGDVRDHRGHLRGLPGIAAEQIRAAGLHITNELILVSPAGLKAKTTRPGWEANRTTTRRHQVVIVAVKGDRGRATAAIKGEPC